MKGAAYITNMIHCRQTAIFSNNIDFEGQKTWESSWVSSWESWESSWDSSWELWESSWVSSWELWVVLWTYKSNHTWQTWYMTNTYIFKQHRLWRTKKFVHWNPIPKCPTPAKPDYPAHLRWHIQIEYTQHHHHVGCVGWRKVFEIFSVFRPLLSKFFLWWISKISTMK